MLSLAGVLARAPHQSRFPFASAPVVARAQRRRLRAAVAAAYEHVPYYRETMRRLGLGPGDLREVGDLARLPLIEREQLQRDPEYFTSRAQPLDSYLPLRSSGSTGEPVRVFYDRAAVRAQLLYRHRARVATVRLAGRRLRHRVAVIVPPHDASIAMGEAARHQQVTLARNPLRLSMASPMSENIERLNAFKPEVISSYGSYLEVLFAHLHRTHERFHVPRLLAYSSDSLSEPARRLIGEQFAIPVLGAYQALEAYQIAFECEAHRGLHVNVDLYPLRVVDEEGREPEVGEPGQVVVSNLVNRATLLLNYRLGDLARWLPGGCSCGRSLPLLSFVEGRRDDWVRAASGEPVHPGVLSALFGSVPLVWSYQVAQEAPTRFTVRLVLAPGPESRSVPAAVRHRLAAVLGQDAAIDVRVVDSLPRTPGGKVRSVVPQPSGAA